MARNRFEFNCTKTNVRPPHLPLLTCFEPQTGIQNDPKLTCSVRPQIVSLKPGPRGSLRQRVSCTTAAAYGKDLAFSIEVASVFRLSVLA